MFNGTTCPEIYGTKALRRNRLRFVAGFWTANLMKQYCHVALSNAAIAMESGCDIWTNRQSPVG
jgi:hypothetical protein